jgi:hypothetical protein
MQEQNLFRLLMQGLAFTASDFILSLFYQQAQGPPKKELFR